MIDKRQFSGRLVVYSQEGGYASPAVHIGGEELTTEIEEWILSAVDMTNESLEVIDAPGTFTIDIVWDRPE